MKFFLLFNNKTTMITECFIKLTTLKDEGVFQAAAAFGSFVSVLVFLMIGVIITYLNVFFVFLPHQNSICLHSHCGLVFCSHFLFFSCMH